MLTKRQFQVALVTAVILTAAACGGAGRTGDDFTIDLYTGRDLLVGDEVTFESALELGRPIVLNFFGGDCPPCVVEMPRLEDA